MLGLVAKTFPEVLLEARLRGGAEDRAESEVALSVPWVAQSGEERPRNHRPAQPRQQERNRPEPRDASDGWVGSRRKGTPASEVDARALPHKRRLGW